MKITKKLLAAVLAALLTLSLAACDKGGLGIPSGQVTTDDFQKNLHQTDRVTFVETDTGFYFAYGWLYYMEKGDLRTTLVCSKPECDHQDEDICNGIINGSMLCGGDKLHFLTLKWTDGAPARLVHSIGWDGTGRETVQALKFQETSASQSSYDPEIYHRGYIYYVSDDVLYRVKLGGEKDSAEAIWKPENAGQAQSHDGIIDFDPNAIHFTLWADGETLYFMVNAQTEDGTYKDVLFQCDLDGSDVRQVWVTPDKEDVGEWETTGVEVSQWYITDGYIYFYLAGNGFWRTELASGKNERLADTSEKVPYGSAIFSDDYMCVFNDYPILFYGVPTPTPGGMFRSYGDTVFVYGLDGTFVKEISLKNLYDDPNAMAETHLLCCAGNDIFFLTIGRTPAAGSGMVSATTKQGDTNLCHANIETGEVEVIYTLRKGQ